MKDFIDWELLDFKGKTTGKILLKCPACSEHRRPQNRNKKCLSVNLDEGVGYCHNCNKATTNKKKQEVENKDYQIPKQDWKNYTDLSDEIVEWLESRKIKQYTAIELGWTMENKWQHQLKKEIPMLCFNSFEGDTVVNKKYRTGVSKYFTQDAGGKPIFYNINAAIGEKELYIVEGQMDVAAFYEVGIKNVISLPNGAQDNDDVWSNSKKYLGSIEKFYIAVDNDEPGRIVSEKISHRIGKWKCEKIIYKNKDANDDLIEGKDVLLASIGNSEKYPVLGTFTAEDLYTEMLDIYDKGLPPVIKPKHSCFEELNKIFSVMRGHLVVATGIPSHGKSNWTEWYVMNLVQDHAMKAAFFSPEHIPMSLHMTSFVEKAFGKNYFREFPNLGIPRITKEEVLKYSIWSRDKIYLTSPADGEYANWEWLINKFNEIRFTKGADIFVVDAFNKVEFDDNGPERQNIKKVLGRLTDFAMRNNAIVIVVAHPTKMDKKEDGTYRMPNLYDVSGSADFRNMTHDGYCIYRTFSNELTDGFTTFANLKTKMNFQGEIGKSVDFEYHLPSGRFFPRDEEPPTHCLFEEEEKPEQLELIPKISPNEAFNSEDDDLPF